MTNQYTFTQYAESHHDIIFRKSGDKHKKDVRGRILRFGEFRGVGDRLINDVRTNDIHIYMDHVVSNLKLSESTANRYGVAVTAVMNNALENGIVSHKCSVDLYEEQHGRPRYFSDEEIQKITTFLRYSRNAWMEHMFTFALHTGARLGEIIRIGVDAEFYYDDDGDPVLWLPDSKNGCERYFHLTKDSKAAYDALRAINEGLAERGGRKRHFYCNSEFYRTWSSMRRKIAPNDKHFVFHVTRHTAATHFANRLNLGSLVIKNIMGHKRMETTSKYVKLETDTAKDAATKMQTLADERKAS